MPEPRGYEYQMSDKPPTEVPLPETKADHYEFKASKNSTLQLAAEIAGILVAAKIMVWAAS